MLDKEWCYSGRPNRASHGHAVAEFNELHGETPGDTRRTGEEDLHRRLYAIPHARRPGICPSMSVLACGHRARWLPSANSKTCLPFFQPSGENNGQEENG